MKAFTSTLALSLGLLAAGCGSLGNADSPRVLTTLHGQLDNPQSVALSGAGANVRIAVIWRNVTSSTDFSVAEDLPVQPVFPSAFQIDIDGPPPATAMNSGSSLQSSGTAQPTNGTTANGSSSSSGGTATPTTSGPAPASGGGSASAANVKTLDDPSQIPADFEFAVGQVVAYQDLNGNGALDLVGDDATSYTDQIVGANQDLILVYLSGTLPSPTSSLSLADSTGAMPSLGYNLYKLQECEVTPSSGGDNCTSSSQWFDMSTLYDLPVSNDPTLNNLMCEGGEGSSSVGAAASGGPDACATPGAAQASYATGGTCATDGSYVTYSTCTTTSEGPCKGTLTTCTASIVCRPSTVPANWPCPGTSS